jgi:hypothetical protein
MTFSPAVCPPECEERRGTTVLLAHLNPQTRADRTVHPLSPGLATVDLALAAGHGSPPYAISNRHARKELTTSPRQGVALRVQHAVRTSTRLAAESRLPADFRIWPKAADLGVAASRQLSGGTPDVLPT